MYRLILIYLLFAMLPSLALAAQVSTGTPTLYQALSMSDMAETLDLLGLPHQSQNIDGKGVVADTRLIVADGVTWFFYGYNCHKKDMSCPEFQMRAVIETDSLQLDIPFDIDQWNRNKRFVRAYRSTSGQALILEMDIYLAGGVTLSNITDQILLWRQSLREFSLALGAK